jgi:predicted lipoprotein with Yx(FWY)xxD motif
MLRRIATRTVGFGVSLAAVALLAVACGGSTPAAGGGTSTTTAPAATTTTTAPTTSSASGATGSTVALKTASGTAGIWLTDQAGRTLYIYTKDNGSTSACYGQCATNWPPLTATGPVTITGQFVSQTLVGSAQRTDGMTQVTYGGKPLYYYKGDTAPSDVKGQGVGGVWYILGPKANIMK